MMPMKREASPPLGLSGRSLGGEVMGDIRMTRVGTGEFDSAGTATVTIGCPSGVRWRITAATVSTTSTARTTASLYLGAPTDSGFLEGTYSGNRDATNTEHLVLGGEVVTCVWTGGTPGARATLRLAGVQSEDR